MPTVKRLRVVVLTRCRKLVLLDECLTTGPWSPTGEERRAQDMPRRTVEAGQGNSAMTERDPRPGSGGVKDNVRDELAESQESR